EVVTEALLTRRIQEDPLLQGVGLVIFDEFHERSIHADCALALALKCAGRVPTSPCWRCRRHWTCQVSPVSWARARIARHPPCIARERCTRFAPSTASCLPRDAGKRHSQMSWAACSGKPRAAFLPS